MGAGILAVGVSVSGCDDSQQAGNLMTNPELANGGKGASTLGLIAIDPVPVDDETYDGVCADPVADAEICLKKEFHQVAPRAKATTYVTGEHVPSSKYKINDSTYLEHINDATNANYSKYRKTSKP